MNTSADIKVKTSRDDAKHQFPKVLRLKDILHPVPILILKISLLFYVLRHYIIKVSQ